jgi:hypothetical protein
MLSWPTAFLRLEDATEKALQTLHKRLVPERAARAGVPTQQLQVLFRHRTFQQGLPIANDPQQRRDPHQAVVTSRQVGPRTAPTPGRQSNACGLASGSRPRFRPPLLGTTRPSVAGTPRNLPR